MLEFIYLFRYSLISLWCSQRSSSRTRLILMLFILIFILVVLLLLLLTCIRLWILLLLGKKHTKGEKEKERAREIQKKMACFLRTCLLALKITSKPVLRSGVSSREKFFGNEMNRQKNLSSSYFSNQSIKLPSISQCFLLFYFRLPFFFFNFILPF